jgi:hypothetical protein
MNLKLILIKIQVLVIGTSILEYINEDDHDELIHNLTNNHEPNRSISFTNRFKSTLIKTPTNQQQSFLNSKIKNINSGWRVGVYINL